MTPPALIVPYAPGGSSDRARIVADKLTARLGAPVVVENKTGAGGRPCSKSRGLPASQNVLVLPTWRPWWWPLVFG